MMNLDQYKGCPEWAKNVDPAAHGYPSYMDRAIERRQLDECIEATDETVEYLYNEFTPKTCDYPRGSRPLLEMIVDDVCADCDTDLERALALINWRRTNYQHVGKCGLGTEEEILLGGYSMCHDASRCFITLCQVAGLGARMIIGLHDEKKTGHTLTEAYVAGKWVIFDPSPGIPYAYYKLPDGTFANAWDIRQDPTIPSRCTPHVEESEIRDVSIYFRNYRLANYSLKESTRNVGLRFLRLITAKTIVDNYDYLGHVNHTPPSAFTDLDAILSKWLEGTVRKEQ